MSKFGWCITGNHTSCRKQYNKPEWVKKRVGRKTEEVLVITDEVIKCDCKCHPKEKK